MHLIQLLLPLYDNDGVHFAQSLYAQVRGELVERFGGLTAYTRAPAAGVWEEAPGRHVRDDIVIYEIMAEALDRDWWQRYRTELEQRFVQEKLVVRATAVQLL